MKVFVCILLPLIAMNAGNVFAQNQLSSEQEITGFGKPLESFHNFTGELYYLSEYTIQLPDFDTLESVGKIYTKSFRVPEQNFELGFPGVSDRIEYFAIDFRGNFYTESSGNHCFLLASDDGSKLFIDDRLVINNDFIHEMIFKKNCVYLEEGIHNLRLQYFQGPRYGVGLVLQYKRQEEEIYRIFNLDDFPAFSVQEDENEINVSMSGDILFEFDSYQLNELAKESILSIKRLVFDKNPGKAIVIEGHTDNVGSAEYNLRLAFNRANAVKAFLIQQGIPSGLLEMKSYGETKPKVPNDSEENRQINRRIEIRVTKN